MSIRVLFKFNLGVGRIARYLLLYVYNKHRRIVILENNITKSLPVGPRRELKCVVLWIFYPLLISCVIILSYNITKVYVYIIFLYNIVSRKRKKERKKVLKETKKKKKNIFTRNNKMLCVLIIVALKFLFSMNITHINIISNHVENYI